MAIWFAVGWGPAFPWWSSSPSLIPCGAKQSVSQSLTQKPLAQHFTSSDGWRYPKYHVWRWHTGCWFFWRPGKQLGRLQGKVKPISVTAGLRRRVTPCHRQHTTPPPFHIILHCSHVGWIKERWKASLKWGYAFPWGTGYLKLKHLRKWGGSAPPLARCFCRRRTERLRDSPTSRLPEKWWEKKPN